MDVSSYFATFFQNFQMDVGEMLKRKKKAKKGTILTTFEMFTLTTDFQVYVPFTHSRKPVEIAKYIFRCVHFHIEPSSNWMTN